MQKGAGDENFPVASKLLPAWSRPHVMAFYAFARAADDVADASHVSPDEKLNQLQSMSTQLANGAPAPDGVVYDLHQSLEQTEVTPDHAQDLLKAFMWDVQHPRTDDWDALMAYCALSAAPVGRYLIDLLGGCEGGYGPSDALCAALQVLNHLQDIKDDFNQLDRVYVPRDWMAKHGVAETDLKAQGSSAALRQTLDQMLDGVDELLRQAGPLPGAIRSRALAREAGGILVLAERLSQKLRKQDPLAGRVALSKPMMGVWFMWGALRRPVVYP